MSRRTAPSWSWVERICSDSFNAKNLGFENRKAY
jgi:hypothetical protein